MRLQVIKGSPSLAFTKGEILWDTKVEHQGHGVYSVRMWQPAQMNLRALESSWQTGRHRTLYARLINHAEFNLNNGDPTRSIRVRQLPDFQDDSNLCTPRFATLAS